MYSISILLLAASVAAAGNSEESILTTARLKTTDRALLDFFRKRSQPFPPRSAIEQLARTLADPDAAKADAAQGELVSLGACAAPVLREVANHRDEEPRAAERAKQILRAIEGPESDRLPIEAVHLLAEQKPAGATEALLDYLPFADNDRVVEEVESALVAVGFRDGKPDPAVLAALKDRRAVRRGAAARILCQAGGATYTKAVRPLLHDAEPAIRLKAARALADADDTQAIPVLIDLLAEAPLPVQAQVEEYLTQLAGEWAVSGPRGHDLLSCQLRRDIWAAWWKSTTGERLLKEFQTRILTDEELEKASLLLGARKDEKPQSSEPAVPLPGAAFRLLRLRRPQGTVATLLAFLPCAEEEKMVGQIAEILSDVGVMDGKPDEVLVKALQDRIGVRRAVAAVALCRGRATDVLPVVRKLLADKDIEVRRRVAWELASGGDKQAIVVLSGLLGDLPSDRAWEVEAFMERLAGDKAPVEITSEPVNWKNVASAWMAWWKGDRSKVVMIDSRAVFHGYTLLVQPQANTVTELGRDGKPRWTLTGLSQPRDAQVMLGGQRVLLAEQNRVTERDLRGKILWQKEVFQPRGAQRLRNGNTFIVCQNQLLEVDRAGREVLKVQLGAWIMAARKLPNGQIVVAILGPGHLIRLDQTGRELKRTQLNIGNGYSEILDNGHVLVSRPVAGEFKEYDADGKEVNHLAIPGATNGFRMPNGHTLVAIDGPPPKCIELDKNWKPIEETILPAPTWRVKRR